VLPECDKNRRGSALIRAQLRQPLRMYSRWRMTRATERNQGHKPGSLTWNMRKESKRLAKDSRWGACAASEGLRAMETASGLSGRSLDSAKPRALFWNYSISCWAIDSWLPNQSELSATSPRFSPPPLRPRPRHLRRHQQSQRGRQRLRACDLRTRMRGANAEARVEAAVG